MSYSGSQHRQFGEALGQLRAIHTKASIELETGRFHRSAGGAEAEDHAKLQREAQQVATFDTAIRRGHIRPAPARADHRWMLIAAPVFGLVAAAASAFVRF